MSRPYPMKAILEMEAALRYYRDSRWNQDYPGGIDNWPNEAGLDFGYCAKRALAHPVVKRAVQTAKELA